MLRRRQFVAILAVLAATLAAAAPASARPRWPIIGCWNLNSGAFNHYTWKYAPSGCTITSTTAGIAHVHWKHWGQRQATGKGEFVDDLGFTYPARMTAYKLHVTHNFLGDHTYAAWYSKLHVVASREFRGGIYRGPFNLFLDVTPWE